MNMDPLPGGACDEAGWPDVDSGDDFSGVCGECKVLVHFGVGFDTPYGGTCSSYCTDVGGVLNKPMEW